jgi:hypothetical protein
VADGEAGYRPHWGELECHVDGARVGAERLGGRGAGGFGVLEFGPAVGESAGGDGFLDRVRRWPERRW